MIDSLVALMWTPPSDECNRALSAGGPRPRRAGGTLIEMVLVISITGLIATSAVRIFHALMRHQATATVEIANAVSWQQLHKRLATDIQAARSAEVTEAALTLRPNAGDGNAVIEWRQEAHAMLRSEGIRRDQFELPEGSTIAFQMEALSGEEPGDEDLPSKNARQVTLIRLIVSRSGGERDQRYVEASHQRSMVAELARNYRYRRLDASEKGDFQP